MPDAKISACNGAITRIRTSRRRPISRRASSMTGFALRETRGTPSSPISYACSATPCRHGERGRQHVTDTVSGFIARLLIHIPDGKFHQIRYYGFYSNRTRSRPRHRKMSSEPECSEVRRFLRWENRLMSVYGYTPLLCECGARMRINYRLSYFPGMEFEEWERKDSG